MTLARQFSATFACLVFLVGASAAAGTVPAGKVGAWSKAVNGIAGRLEVAQATIESDGHFALTLELANRGSAPLAIQADSPLLFAVTVQDEKGQRVDPTTYRIDILTAAAQWRVIPAGGTLRMAVSFKQEDGARDAHLDVTTALWTLAPGRYRIAGTFQSNAKTEAAGVRGKAKIWEVKIELPPIQVEVRGK